MNLIIEYSDNFLREAKKLSKKFRLLKSDLEEALKEIEQNNDFGVFLGCNLFKKRIQNSSIPTGKSGGFRVIIYLQLEDTIVLISIYSKTEKESLSDDELRKFVEQYFTDEKQKS